MKIMSLAYVILGCLLLSACETTDGQLQQRGYNPGYIEGFHDGRHSGIAEAGNPYDHYIRDTERFAEDQEYHNGWLEGEAEGKKLQAQADAVSGTMSGAIISGGVNNELDKQDPKRVGEKVLKNTDTSGLKDLGN